VSGATVLVQFTDEDGRDVRTEFYVLGEGSFVRVEEDNRGRIVFTANASMQQSGSYVPAPALPGERADKEKRADG
jgi:hypothetical protein